MKFYLCEGGSNKMMFNTHRRRLLNLWIYQEKNCSVHLRGTWTKQGAFDWTLSTFSDDNPVEITQQQFEEELFIGAI